MTESSRHDLECFARAELDAARKDLSDCRNRENETFQDYLDAMDTTMWAIVREQKAFSAWFEASRPVTAQEQEP